MGAIDIFLEHIRHAVYGKDVRESIASGIEQCYHDSTANAQMEAIEEKGAEVLASIPDDYTELSEDVAGLKSALQRQQYPGSNQVTTLFYTQGGYFVNTDGSYRADANWGYTDLIPCEPNRTYFINTPTPQYICFYDSSKEFISGAGATSAKSPTTAAFVRISAHYTRQATAVLTIDEPYNNYVADLQNDLSKIEYSVSIEGTSGQTNYRTFSFINGHTYKFTNSSSDKANVASCDMDNNEVQAFGQVNGNGVASFIATANAERVCVYYRASGSVTVEDMDMRLPVAEKHIEELLPVINYESEDKNNIDKIDYLLENNIKKSENVADLSQIVECQITVNGIVPQAGSGTIKIPVFCGSTYRVYIDYTLMGVRYAITDGNDNVLFSTTTATDTIEIKRRNAKYLYIYYPGATTVFYANHNAIVTIDTDVAPSNYITPIKGGYKLSGLIENPWRNKNVVVYGDSITAQGNGGGQFYFDAAYKKYEFANLYTRGVGGQSYQYNTATFYANSDGSYNSRDSGGNPPAGTTEHHGYFSSWDRITAMIPSAIRESIDLVVLCGGTNDFQSIEGVDIDTDFTEVVPEWKPNSTDDSVWANSSYYTGGDYDIKTFAGAIASTIYKFQIWCPNAIVILATPFPFWNGKQQRANSAGLYFRQICQIEISVAQYMSTPIIDANSECNINSSNFVDCTLSDLTHPNDLGRKMYGLPFVAKLATIPAK